MSTAPGRQWWESPRGQHPSNRRLWNRISSAYQHRRDPRIGAEPRLWGMYSISDAHLNALGDVTGKRVLELGCGAGQWSRALATEGATVVGLDLSEAQLGAASRRPHESWAEAGAWCSTSPARGSKPATTKPAAA
ncbi:class I SAM-dependent methyltransferase [Streptomyces scabiei]|uniref:class I SAM-dependent methyltransferase n=1 Tax=Streptomyces scabiei TaxID=1930 RepID=UPI0038F6B73D